MAPSLDSNLQPKTELWNHALGFTKSMSLKCAIELGIPKTIHNHGKPMTIPELAVALSIPQSKTYALSCLMRLLTSSGVFTSTKTKQEHLETYDLTNISRHLMINSSVSASPLILLTLCTALMTPSMHIGPWLKGTASTAFYMVHGMDPWDLANVSPEFNDTLNKAMASDAALMKDLVAVQGRDYGLFDGVSSMVDVGGGTGTMAKALKKKYPGMKCMVLDLPHVVETVRDKGSVEFIGGDMFVCVPPADVVMLKWVLHDWADEHCVQILQHCRDAIPPKENGGKIIIIEIVVGVNIQDDTVEENDVGISFETQLMLDMLMMIEVSGKERTECEWVKIFKAAGLSEYKMTPSVGLRSIIEVYK